MHSYQPSGTTANIYSESVSAMNDLGMVAGYANRYTSTGDYNGEDAWVFDPQSGKTVAVDPADATQATYTNSFILYLSPAGVALGQYATDSSSSFHAFVWTQSGGFDPLTNMNIPAGLSASGYQNLIGAYFSNANGSSILATASFTDSNNADGLVTLTAVPEPTTLALMSVGLLGLTRRRRV